MLYGYYTFDLPNHRQCFTMNAGVNSCFRDDQDKQLPEAFSALTDSSTLHHCHTAKTKRRKTFNHHQKKCAPRQCMWRNIGELIKNMSYYNSFPTVYIN